MISQESRLPLNFLEDLEFHSELSTAAKLTNKRISRIGSFSAATETFGMYCLVIQRESFVHFALRPKVDVQVLYIHIEYILNM